MLILISDPFDADLPKRLKSYGDVTDDKSRLSDAEIILVRSKTKVNREFIDSAPKLKLVIRGGVGMDTIDEAYCAQKGITATNTAEASTVAVAELAFAMMIALPNHIVKADNAVKAGQFPKSELTRTELFGKTLGILGFGRIGTSIAVRAKAFNMRVIAWNPHITYSEFAELTLSRQEMFAASDYLSLNLPLNSHTKGMINKESLGWLKPGAFMINTGRGECVVEADVAEALGSGRLAGYATDVYSQEPPTGSPLLTAPNTLLLPHLGASTKENMRRIGIVVEKLVAEYVGTRKG